MTVEQYDDESIELMDRVTKDVAMAELVLAHRDACIERGKMDGRVQGLREAKSQEGLAFIGGLALGVALTLLVQAVF